MTNANRISDAEFDAIAAEIAAFWALPDTQRGEFPLWRADFDKTLAAAYRREERRRMANATRAANAEARKAAAVAAGTYAVGEVVEVHAFGHWYRGEVTKLGRTKVTVKYTSGTGVTREKAVDSAKIRKVV